MNLWYGFFSISFKDNVNNLVILFELNDELFTEGGEFEILKISLKIEKVRYEFCQRFEKWNSTGDIKVRGF